MYQQGILLLIKSIIYVEFCYWKNSLLVKELIQLVDNLKYRVKIKQFYKKIKTILS